MVNISPGARTLAPRLVVDQTTRQDLILQVVNLEEKTNVSFGIQPNIVSTRVLLLWLLVLRFFALVLPCLL